MRRRLPVVKVGRIAGQFAKPRSSPTRRRTARNCRAIAATSSTASSSPRKRAGPTRRGRSRPTAIRPPRSTCCALRARRLCQPRQCPPVDARLRQGLAAVAPLRGARRPHLRGARLHAGLRARSREPSRAQEHRLLHQPRGAAARLRAGDDARGFDPPGHVLLHLGAHAVDRRPHPPARPCPCRVLPRHHQSARAQMRAVEQGRRAAAPDRHSQSGERAGPADADRAARRRQGRRAAAGR